ncbi:MAG TPA: Trk system potassium transporter TrkA [Desulfobacterales bacterium]|nr:Trk system potassium transporter TrkA [Desulfobacterales bacterium]
MRVVIIGAGEVGFHIARHLSIEKKDVVVIDEDPEAIRRVSDHLDVQVITGSGSNPAVLEEAGIRGADIMLAVTDRDETNLVACMVTDLLAPNTHKIARIRAAGFDDFHETFRSQAPHIDTIINPLTEVVKTIYQLMSVPGAADVGQFADGRIKFVGVYMETTSRLAGVKLSDLPAKAGTVRPLIAAVVREDHLIIPRGKDRLMPGDLVYFISEEEKLFETLAVFGKHADPIKRVLIIGGGRIGYRLAALLEEKSISSKVIDKNLDRCSLLAERLNETVVLCGDGSDQALLAEENICEMDVVVTVTDDEETNILTALLATRMGARKSIAKIDKFGYFSLMKAIGIEQVVSPRLSAINSILQHIRKGKVLSAMSIKGEQAEVMEAVALETSDIVGRPLRDVDFPKGAMVVGVIRAGKIIIPSGASVIAPEDRVIIFAQRDAIPKIESILAVKLEYF